MSFETREPRGKRIVIRLTEDEKEKIRAYSDSAGVSMSEYIRQLVMLAIEEERS